MINPKMLKNSILISIRLSFFTFVEGAYNTDYGTCPSQ